MGATANISMNVALENEADVLEVINKSLNDEYEDLKMSGLTTKSLLECSDLVVNEIVTNEDGIEIELYKSKTKKLNIIQTSRREMRFGDIIKINGESLIIINFVGSVNLYSYDKQLFYFENNLQSIQEIIVHLENNNVKYEVYILR